MKITKTKFKDLLLFDSKNFYDSRGYFREVLIEKIVKKRFKFTVVSKSKKNVVRGLHMQRKFQQGKYISVLKGKILDVGFGMGLLLYWILWKYPTSSTVIYRNYNTTGARLASYKLPIGKKYSNKIMLECALDQFIKKDNFDYLIYSTADIIVPNNLVNVLSEIK